MPYDPGIEVPLFVRFRIVELIHVRMPHFSGREGLLVRMEDGEALPVLLPEPQHPFLSFHRIVRDTHRPGLQGADCESSLSHGGRSQEMQMSGNLSPNGARPRGPKSQTDWPRDSFSNALRSILSDFLDQGIVHTPVSGKLSNK